MKMMMMVIRPKMEHSKGEQWTGETIREQPVSGSVAESVNGSESVAEFQCPLSSEPSKTSFP